MHFGFSYVGLVYLVMLMLPNLIWTKNQPTDYEKYARNENKVLLAFERIGEVLVSCFSLIFSDFNIKPWSSWSWWLVLSFVLMILYEVFWIRYFRSEKTMKDFLQQHTWHPGSRSNAACAGISAVGHLWKEQYSGDCCCDSGNRTHWHSSDAQEGN